LIRVFGFLILQIKVISNIKSYISFIRFQGFSIFGLFAITGTSIASVVTYTGLILLSTAQIACAAIFPGIGMTLGYGKEMKLTLYIQRKT